MNGSTIYGHVKLITWIGKGFSENLGLYKPHLNITLQQGRLLRLTVTLPLLVVLARSR